MYLQKCEHPKRIWNKYTKEFVYVPCGRCASCHKQKSTRWVERLNVERKCWKYCVFFTLTYAPEYVPLLKKRGHFLMDLTHRHQAPDQEDAFIDVDEYFAVNEFKYSDEDKQRSISLLENVDSLSYLSVYDIQCFFKRLKKHLHLLLSKYFENNYGTEDEIIRYYLVGEYGSYTKRCHYHGLLFFSSEKEASQIEEALRKSWKFGIVDTSFVSGSNSAYVAKYLNCISDLPSFYEHKSLRPFAVFSKQPPIGTLYFRDEQIREIFDQASPKMFVDYLNDLKIHDVPLWRTYQDMLFPKIPLFSKVSHYDRTLLYRTVSQFQDSFGPCFSVADISFRLLTSYNDNPKHFVSTYLHCYDDYISALHDNLKEGQNLYNSIFRWLQASARVINQAAVFCIPLNDYIAQIEKFYDNCEKEKLSLQYRFMQEFSEKYDTVVPLIGIDRVFLESVIDADIGLLSYEEILILESFGIDIQKFTSDDLSERQQYISQLIPENTLDYIRMRIDNGVWNNKSLKKKKMNDYLESHQDLLEPFLDYLPNINNLTF